SNVNEFKSELQDLHESIEGELNKRYVNYLRAYFNSEGESRKIYFTDGEDFKKKISEFEEPKYVKIESKKSGLDRMDEELSELFPNNFKWVGKGEIDPEDAELIAEKIEQHGADNLKYGYIEDQFRSKRLSEDGNYTPLHWILEFPEIFDGDQEGFDIVLGNPPYGSDVLSNNEKQFLQPYKTEGCGDICGYFLEREIYLTRADGFVGNVIADSLAVNNSMTSVRDLMRDKGKFELSFFGTRPSKIFAGVEERVCIINGRKTSGDNPIYTAKNMRFTQEMRSNLFDEIEFASTEGLVLGSKIGVRNDEEATRLPKIGSEKARTLLEDLKGESKVLEKWESSEGASLDLKTSGGYWVQALKEFPHQSTMIESITFETDLKRDLALIGLNSSLFYFYWAVYANNRHVFGNLVDAFPVPEDSRIKEYRDRINEFADEIDDCQRNAYSGGKGRTGEFDTAKCKSKIDEIDELLGIYGLTDSQVEFIKNYDGHIRPNKSGE
ncbi:MAG: Eco57I restriction-modification methylase domain-containing protein, partial [Candidatus Nanohaloarchaea archaeon]